MNHRLARVSELIKRELGTILERNFTFSGSFVTIHEVNITPDLKHAVIYVGVLGKGDSNESILRRLNAGRPLIQRELYKRVVLKNSPTLLFKETDSIERGVRVLNIIENLPEPLPDEAPEGEDEELNDENSKDGEKQ